MKKMFALLVVMMICMTMLPMTAMAYTAVTPGDDMIQLKHTLTLTDATLSALSYNVTYTFTVNEEAEVVEPTSIKNKEHVVIGTPSIATIEYTPADQFDTNKSCTKPLVIDWTGVAIKEPGVYRWAVTKSVADTDPNNEASNGSGNAYLYAVATINGGALQIDKAYLQNAADNTKGNLADQFPAKTLDLSVTKKVAGNQGSKEQYFKFTISLSHPAGAAAKTYTITGADATVLETAYNDSTTNPATVTVGSEGGTVDLWLKADQTAVIKDLLYGTSYTVVETENDGYEVEVKVDGDKDGTKIEGATASDTSLIVSATVTYTNTKNPTVPTGITLNTMAPIMGILLAISLLGVLCIGKRKEYGA